MKTNKSLFFINENESVRALKLFHSLLLISYQVMDFQWLILKLDQKCLIKLFNEFKVFKFALVAEIHYWFASFDFSYGHRNWIFDGFKQQKHDSVTNFEFGQKFMFDYVL